MPVTANINGLSVIHQTSNGIATATVPDVCKTPSQAGPIPIPYPNVAMSSDLVSGTSTVTIDGSSAATQGSKFAKSTGDEAGSAGGVVSGVFAMEATFISFSPTVMLDGKPVCRLTDKMVMNKGNTVCMAGADNPFLSPAEAFTPATLDDAIYSIAPEAPKLCVLRQVIVSCGHPERKISIDLSKKEGKSLQVISKADKPDHLIIEWDGTCGAHHAYCPTVGVSHKGDWILADKAKGTLNVPAQELSVVRDWFSVLQVLLSQQDLPRDYYTINARLCMGHDAADVETGQWLQVQVFPEVEWKADFSISYSHKHAKDTAGKERPFDYEPASTWIVGGSAEAALGRDKFSYALDSGVKADALPLFGSLLSKIGKCAVVFDSMAIHGLGVHLTEKWPNWKMGGGLKLVELPNKLIVGSEGHFKFEFAPLFGIGLEVSILDWLLKFAGALAGPPGIALAKFLTKLRERMAQGAGTKDSVAQGKLDIDIVAKIEGEIKGGFGMKYADGKGDIDPDAALIGGSISVSVNGHIIGTGRAWIVQASAAVQVGSSAVDGTALYEPDGTAPNKLDGTKPSKIEASIRPKGGKAALTPVGHISFTGLAVYYLGFIEFGVKKEETARSGSDDDYKPRHKMSWTERYETKGTCVLLEAWTWPKEHA